MLTAEAIVGSGTVPPRVCGNEKLISRRPAASAAGLRLICCRVSLRVLLGAGPAGQRQSRPMLVVGSGTDNFLRSDVPWLGSLLCTGKQQ